MQCREVRDLADSFLSEQLLVETNHEVLRHLEGCSECRAELESRRTLRATIQRAFMNAETLRMRVGFARDITSSLRASGWGAGRFSWVWRIAAAAAVVAIVAGAGLFLLFGAESAMARDAVGDHRNCAVEFRLAEKPISLEEATRYAEWYRLLQDTPSAEFTTEAGAVRVIERHACVFNGRRFAHIVLRFQGRLVSLLITEDDSWVPDLANAQEPRRLASQPVAGGFRSVSFRMSGHRIFLVGNVAEPELRQIAETLVESVARRLAGA